MKLPEIYKNPIKDNPYNSQSIYRSDDNSHVDLNDLPNYFIIQTAQDVYEVKIIGKTTYNLVSDDGKIIKLKDIISIKKR